MQNFIAKNWVGLIAIVIAISFGFANQVALNHLEGTIGFGAVGTRFPDGISVGTTVAATRYKLLIGTSGTVISQEAFGTCNLATGGAGLTIAPFANRNIDCGSGTLGTTALTGVQANDNVALHLATTTPLNQNSLTIESVSASSTAGFITAVFYNASTTAITLTNTSTSTLEWRVLHN